MTYPVYLILSPALRCEVKVGVQTNDDSGSIKQEPRDCQISPPLASCPSWKIIVLDIFPQALELLTQNKENIDEDWEDNAASHQGQGGPGYLPLKYEISYLEGEM